MNRVNVKNAEKISPNPVVRTMPRRLPLPAHGFGSLVAVVLALAASGCGKLTGNITGKVIYEGKPLPGGYVNFTNEGDSPTVKTSTIKPDGSYSISHMPVGPAKITVQGILGPAGPASKAAVPGGSMPAGGRKTVYVPPQYGNTSTSDLTYPVVSGGQTHDIELK